MLDRTTDQQVEGALIPRATVEEIVANRNKAIELYAEAFDAIALADQKLKAAFTVSQKAAPGYNSFYNGHEKEVEAFHNAVELPPDRAQYLRVAGGPLAIGFNPNYVRDLLNALGSGTVELTVFDPRSPAIWRWPDLKGPFIVLSPMWV